MKGLRVFGLALGLSCALGVAAGTSDPERLVSQMTLEPGERRRVTVEIETPMDTCEYCLAPDSRSGRMSAL